MEKGTNPISRKIVFMEEDEFEKFFAKCFQTEISKLNINSAEKEDRILLIEDAMKFLGVSRQTIYGYTSRKQIPFYKKQKKLYFLEADLLKWLSGGKNKSLDEIREDAIDYLDKRNNGKKK